MKMSWRVFFICLIVAIIMVELTRKIENDFFTFVVILLITITAIYIPTMIGYTFCTWISRLVSKKEEDCVIIPQYKAPPITAAQSYLLEHEIWSYEATAIALLQMVCTNFLAMEKISSNGYILTRTNKKPKNTEEKLYHTIFSSHFPLHLNNRPNSRLNSFNQALKSFNTQGYLTSRSKKGLRYYFFIYCFLISFVAVWWGKTENIRAWGWFFCTIFIGIIGFYKTPLKVDATKQKLKGLKMFLSTVCKNEDVNIKTSSLKYLLPYALALDIDEVWDKIIPQEKTSHRSSHPTFKELVKNALNKETSSP